MKKAMDKMMGKEESEDGSDAQYDAKMAVLEELRALAMELMKGKYGDKLHGLKEITVAAPDENKLTEGLDLAKEMLAKGEMPMDEEEDEDEEDEA